MIVGIDSDKLEFLATDDGQLVVTVRNLTEAMVSRQDFLDAYVTHCKDCALWNDADSEHFVGYCTEGDGEKITFRNEWCCWAEREENG